MTRSRSIKPVVPAVQKISGKSQPSLHPLDIEEGRELVATPAYGNESWTQDGASVNEKKSAEGLKWELDLTRVKKGRVSNQPAQRLDFVVVSAPSALLLDDFPSPPMAPGIINSHQLMSMDNDDDWEKIDSSEVGGEKAAIGRGGCGMMSYSSVVRGEAMQAVSA